LLLGGTVGCRGASTGEDAPDAFADAMAMSDGSPASSDSASEATADDAAAGVDSQSPADACTPMLPDDAGIPPFVPPHPRSNACTPAQLQTMYQACFPPGSLPACQAFVQDPANTACRHCMISRSTESSWGPLVQFSDGSIFPNRGGCAALVDQDAGPHSCGAQQEAYTVCTVVACAPYCPAANTPSGAAEFGQCVTDAYQGVCGPYAPPAQPCSSSAYNQCNLGDFQSSFFGLGEFFCAFADDAGADADARGD
jgi:hypothetical protein